MMAAITARLLSDAEINAHPAVEDQRRQTQILPRMGKSESEMNKGLKKLLVTRDDTGLQRPKYL